MVGLGEGLVRRRRLVIAVVLLVAAALSAGVGRLQVGFRVDGFFESDDPTLQRALALERSGLAARIRACFLVEKSHRA